MPKPLRTERSTGRLGVWLFGALGGLATTVVVGARAVARGLAGVDGLLTETPACQDLGLVGLDRLVFGGHDVRRGSLLQSAEQIQTATGAIPYPLLAALRSDLRRASAEVRLGTAINAGRTITALADPRARVRRRLADELRRIQRDIRAFMARHRLRRCVCVNAISTEPPLRLGPAHRDLARLRAAIARDDARAVRPSTLYALAAADLGLPFVHFTPGNAALVPAVEQRFAETGAPYMGRDGKTGETLVKSALAPMFKYRNLRVLSWQGYNILGDRDGVVLAHAENKRAKVESKDGLLPAILGYPLHTHVGIDYVPSLDDLKTAWDFVHFQGFLGFRMSLQFIWQGCDAILAAPLILDMVRMADLAARRGEAGPMAHLACFFKSPMGCAEHDLHRQWHAFSDYIRAARARANTHATGR